jgi:hypothetical protein
MQLDWHDLRTNGCPALLRALKQIETVMTQQEKDIEVLMDHLVPARPHLLPHQREIVEELGNGCRIERQPPAPNANAATSDQPAANQAATTTVEDIDRQMVGAMTIVDRILHSLDR